MQVGGNDPVGALATRRAIIKCSIDVNCTTAERRLRLTRTATNTAFAPCIYVISISALYATNHLYIR